MLTDDSKREACAHEWTMPIPTGFPEVAPVAVCELCGEQQPAVYTRTEHPNGEVSHYWEPPDDGQGGLPVQIASRP